MSTRTERRAEAMTWAGIRQARFARSTGTLVAVVHGAEAGLDTDGGAWSTICDDHGTVCSHETRALAESHAANPEGWCEECMKLPPPCPSCGGRLLFVAVEGNGDTSYRCSGCGDEWFGSTLEADPGYRQYGAHPMS